VDLAGENNHKGERPSREINAFNNNDLFTIL